jgi:hypothetical protein
MAIGMLIASVFTGFLSSLQEQDAIKDEDKANQKELDRQQGEANRIKQEERSERTLEADRQMASITAGFEAIGGGADSGNQARKSNEEAGAAGLDLARIESNRRSEIGSLQADKITSAQKAKGAIKRSQARFMSNSLSAGQNFFGQSALNTGSQEGAKG